MMELFQKIPSKIRGRIYIGLLVAALLIGAAQTVIAAVAAAQSQGQDAVMAGIWAALNYFFVFAGLTARYNLSPADTLDAAVEAASQASEELETVPGTVIEPEPEIVVDPPVEEVPPPGVDELEPDEEILIGEDPAGEDELQAS